LDVDYELSVVYINVDISVTMHSLEPKKSYDVAIVGGGGHGLATAPYPLALDDAGTDYRIVCGRRSHRYLAEWLIEPKGSTVIRECLDR
jgi:hypothetical protein